MSTCREAWILMPYINQSASSRNINSTIRIVENVADKDAASGSVITKGL
jgi:hypothetical protein